MIYIECNTRLRAAEINQLGESIAEAAIVSFLVQPGDTVEADQDIIEVETSKATMNVTKTIGSASMSIRPLYESCRRAYRA